ncbi:MAG: hypothetical protein WBA51_13525 [Erythrobacter sp.]
MISTQLNAQPNSLASAKSGAASLAISSGLTSGSGPLPASDTALASPMNVLQKTPMAEVTLQSGPNNRLSAAELSAQGSEKEQFSSVLADLEQAFATPGEFVAKGQEIFGRASLPKPSDSGELSLQAEVEQDLSSSQPVTLFSSPGALQAMLEPPLGHPKQSTQLTGKGLPKTGGALPPEVSAIGNGTTANKNSAQAAISQVPALPVALSQPHSANVEGDASPLKETAVLQPASHPAPESASVPSAATPANLAPTTTSIAAPQLASAPTQSPLQPAPAATASLEQTIDHVADLREAGRAVRPELTVRHGEFGTVAMRIDAAAAPADWRATLFARDPGFVPAVQAALAERAIAASAESSLAQNQSQQRGSDSGSHNSPNSQGGLQSSQHNSQSGFGGTFSGGDPRYGSSTGSSQGTAQPYLGEEGDGSSDRAAADQGDDPDALSQNAQGGALFA